MTNVKEGTEGKDTVARPNAEESANATTRVYPSKSSAKAPRPWATLGLGLAIGLGLGWLGHDFRVNATRKDHGAVVKGKSDEAGKPCKV